MWVKISIDVNNQAFADNPAELGEILSKVVVDPSDASRIGETVRLKDSNGNTVGFYEVEDGSAFD
jgi:hypothetical protein